MWGFTPRVVFRNHFSRAAPHCAGRMSRGNFSPLSWKNLYVRQREKSYKRPADDEFSLERAPNSRVRAFTPIITENEEFVRMEGEGNIDENRRAARGGKEGD